MTKRKQTLNEIGNKTPFTTPEGYFDSFGERLQQRISQLPVDDNKPVRKPIPLFERTKPYLYFAAMLAGMYFIIMAAVKIFSTTDTPTNSTEPVVAEATEQPVDDDVFNYLDDDEWIYNLLADSDY